MRQFTHPTLSLTSPSMLWASASIKQITAVCTPLKRFYSLVTFELFRALRPLLHRNLQSCSMPIPYNGFTRFQQLIIYHTMLVPSNAEHNLGTVNIRPGRRCRGMSGHSPWFSALGIIVVDPFFVAGHNAIVKTSSDSVFEAAVHKKRNAIQHLLDSSRTEPNFLASEPFPWFWGVLKWLFESLLMILRILLMFGTSLQQVIPLIRNFRKYSLFHHSRHVLSSRTASP